MKQMSKKEAVAELHRTRIMTSAERLFSEKGYAQTTIADISKASEYSRRTIYAYYESKEENKMYVNYDHVKDTLLHEGYKLGCSTIFTFQDNVRIAV